MEWLPKSRQEQEFLEIDRSEWFDLITRKQKLNEPRRLIIAELTQKVMKMNHL
jgi:predicted NUDIX family NTP pyrophosphohydrolase